MKEFLILAVSYFVFFVLSWILYSKSLTTRKAVVYFMIPFYFISIYFYFELINYIHIYLRNKGTSLDFGHASIDLVIVLLLAYLTAIVFSVMFYINRKRG